MHLPANTGDSGRIRDGMICPPSFFYGSRWFRIGNRRPWSTSVQTTEQLHNLVISRPQNLLRPAFLPWIIAKSNLRLLAAWQDAIFVSLFLVFLALVLKNSLLTAGILSMLMLTSVFGRWVLCGRFLLFSHSRFFSLQCFDAHIPGHQKGESAHDHYHRENCRSGD